MSEPSEAKPLLPSLRVRLAPLRDIVVNPPRAYAQISAAPAWGPAFLVVAVCALLDLRLSAPAVLHVLSQAPQARAHPPPQPMGAHLHDDFYLNSALYVIAQFLVTWTVIAMVASAAARTKGMTIPYRTFFALGAVCSVPGALGALLDGIGVALHPPASYVSLKALAVAVPDNLAIFASPDNSREVAFLSGFGLFDVWSDILLAYGLVALAKLRVTTALVIAFGLDVGLTLLFGA